MFVVFAPTRFGIESRLFSRSYETFRRIQHIWQHINIYIHIYIYIHTHNKYKIVQDVGNTNVNVEKGKTVKFTLEQAMKAQILNGGIALFFL